MSKNEISCKVRCGEDCKTNAKPHMTYADMFTADLAVPISVSVFSKQNAYKSAAALVDYPLQSFRKLHARFIRHV